MRVYAWLLLLSVCLSSCSRQAAPAAPRRIAILRFENLSPDASLDWIGRAFSEVISSELAAAPDVYIDGPARIRSANVTLGSRPMAVPGVSAEEPAAVAAGADRIGYGTYWTWNGRLEARLVLQDTGRMKDVRVLSASVPAGDVLGAASALARQISTGAGSYGTSNERAIQAYSAAIEAGDLSSAETQATLAIGADPNFAPPYRIVAEIKGAQDPSQGLEWLDRALSRPGVPPADRARLEIAAASLRHQPAKLEESYAALAKAEPGDVDNWQSLAREAFVRHDYRQAMTAWQKALAIGPEDANTLNQLAYAAVYSGDLNTALAALRRYTALRPGDVNALDSTGDVYFISGRFKEAEDAYVKTVKQDPNFVAGADWFKAAMARLMTGDVPGADNFAGEFVKARTAAKDSSVPIFAAEWQWLTGRRKAAFRALQQFAEASANGEARQLVPAAYTQLSIWSLLAGDHAAGEQFAGKAISAAGPASALEAVVARFLAQPPASAAEWESRAQRLVPNANQQNIRDLVLAYALLLSHEFAPAVPVLQRLYDSGTTSNNEGLPVLLAWAYLETGRDAEAATLLQSNPVPPIAGPGAFTGMYFPRIFELRARVAEKRGDKAAAETNRKLYAALSGAS
jgi:tetratricopeptide (TPR) repeat protein